jgi:hypothetical protein
MGMAGAAKTVAEPVANPTWETLGQNAGAGRAIRGAGLYAGSGARPDPRTVRLQLLVSSLIVMVVVIVAYFLILRFSETEYREVIAEKFGE